MVLTGRAIKDRCKCAVKGSDEGEEKQYKIFQNERGGTA